ncbi:MAG: YdjY domain-containing protein [Desulfuromonadaceae bacterium]|nr:YdjY domain-containing protein [Desulfuromonadaceae bacterium]
MSTSVLRTMLSVSLCLLLAFPVLAARQKPSGVSSVKSGSDTMTVDQKSGEVRVTSTVLKDCSQPSVCDWGRRFQAFFGAKDGKMAPFFIFSTEINRTDIDKAIKSVGIQSRRQIPMTEVKQRSGLKSTTQKDDYLDGDPLLVSVRWKKDGKMVDVAIEDLIEEKISVDGKDVIKPYTPHFVYHGTAEAINFASGCIVCPSGCNGGIIADNSLPLKETKNYFRFDWNKMPPPGAKVEIVLKSVHGK